MITFHFEPNAAICFLDVSPVLDSEVAGHTEREHLTSTQPHDWLRELRGFVSVNIRNILDLIKYFSTSWCIKVQYDLFSLPL